MALIHKSRPTKYLGVHISGWGHYEWGDANPKCVWGLAFVSPGEQIEVTCIALKHSRHGMVHIHRFEKEDRWFVSLKHATNDRWYEEFIRKEFKTERSAKAAATKMLKRWIRACQSGELPIL